MDKPLYQLPTGEAQAEAIEIELASDMLENDDGSVTIGIGAELEPIENGFDDNLADVIDATELATLATDLLADYENDVNSRADWQKTYTEGLKLLGLKIEDRTEPWAGACGVYSPIITEAVIRFQSETIMETFPAQGPCKTQIIGKSTVDKEDAAKRLQAEMNYQLTDVMIEYRPEHEKMLWNLPITGSAFKKVYFEPALQRQTATFIPAEDIVLPYGVSDIFASPRITHKMRKTKNDILKLQEAGFYRDIDIGDPAKFADEVQDSKDKETGFTANYDNRYTLLEMHVDVYFKNFEDKFAKNQKSKIAVPYVVTVLKDNDEILSIRRNWLEEDVTKQKRQHFVHYQYVPGFGSYGFGLIHLIGSAAKSATALIRQLVDAGTLSNLPGGLKAKGMRIKASDDPIRPGEFRDVDIGSGTVRDNIMPLPYKEPSQTLLALLNQIVEEARRFAATADLKVSDMSAQAPVGTTLALLERMLKIMSAVQARVHYSMKQELKLIAGIIRDHKDVNPDYDYETDSDEQVRARKEDFSHADVIPVSDPNAATMSQRIVQYQAVMQLSQTAPQIYNMPQLHRQMLDVIGIKNAEKLVPLPEDQKPVDPVSENMAVLMGKPLKAFAYQDHEAHIAVHQSFMQDPKIAATMGQNPAAQQMMSGLMAHIAEHTAYAYKIQIEQQLGIPLPAFDDDEDVMDRSTEKRLAPLIAQAAQRTMVMNQAQAAAAANAEAAQNPELALEQMELKLKEQEMQRKAMNDKFDYDVAMARLAMQDKQLQITAQQGNMRLAVDKQGRDADRAAKMTSEVIKARANAARQATAPGRKPEKKE
jgi:hypothetical protein